MEETKKLEKKLKMTQDLLIDISYVVRDLMETNCGNSGKNWHDGFMRDLEELRLID